MASILKRKSQWALVVSILVIVPFAHAFKILPPNTIHQNITHKALDPVIFKHTLSTGRSISFDRLLIGQITFSNIQSDGPDYDVPEVHFDNEALLDGSKRLIDLRKAIALQAIAGNQYSARYNLGKAFHTIQDYYAHTTWVESNLSGGTNLALGTATIVNVPRDEPTCQQFGFLLSASITSGYFDLAQAPLVGETTEAFTNSTEKGILGEWPPYKCIHGSTNGKGIHKDHPGRLFHIQAYDAALASTSLYARLILADIRSATSASKADDAICGLLTDKKCEAPNMLGDRLNFGRRYPTVSNPYWVPTSDGSTTVIEGPQDTVSLGIGTFVGASINPEASVINWTLGGPSEYIGRGGVFDGFVITGFSKDIAAVTISNNTGMSVVMTNTARSVAINFNGLYANGASFVLTFTFQ